VADPRLLGLINELRASRFAGLSGARIVAAIPIAERLLNDVLATWLPASAPVRSVAVAPLTGNRIRVTAKLARPSFLPPVSATLEIEQQPQWPDSPLVLRVISMPGLISMAGVIMPLDSMLPPGVRFRDDRFHLDLRTLLERNGLTEVVQYVESVRVATDEGRLVLDVSARV
jgi:hypothetical protein